jgi:Transposase/DDE superfamily endonuclease
MERRVLGHIQKDKWNSWARVAEDIGDVSRATVQKIAHKHNIHRVRAIRKPAISKVNVQKRLTWATENLEREWTNVIFTDEMTLELGKHQGPNLVSCKPRGRLHPSSFAPKFNSGRRPVMLWGAISYFGKSKLIELEWPEVVEKKDGKMKKGGFTNKQYAEQVLSKGLMSFMEEQMTYTGWEFKVVEDGAPVHKGPFVWQARSHFEFTNLTHPAASPDLNPIENIWSMVKHRVWKVPEAHNLMKNLEAAVQDVWSAITLEEIQHVIYSMPHRVQAVKDANGQATCY